MTGPGISPARQRTDRRCGGEQVHQGLSEQFDAARFTEDLSESRPRYTYFPFGGGPHLCMGNHLAMLEGLLVLTRIAQSYRLRLIPGQAVEPNAMLTLKSPNGFKMELESRAELARHA